MYQGEWRNEIELIANKSTGINDHSYTKTPNLCQMINSKIPRTCNQWFNDWCCENGMQTFDSIEFSLISDDQWKTFQMILIGFSNVNSAIQWHILTDTFYVWHTPGNQFVFFLFDWKTNGNCHRSGSFSWCLVDIVCPKMKNEAEPSGWVHIFSTFMEKWRYTTVAILSLRVFFFAFHSLQQMDLVFCCISYWFAMNMDLPKWKAYNPQSNHCFNYFTVVAVLYRVSIVFSTARMFLWFCI